MQLEAALETKPGAFLRETAMTFAAYIFRQPFMRQHVRRLHRPFYISGVETRDVGDIFGTSFSGSADGLLDLGQNPVALDQANIAEVFVHLRVVGLATFW